MLFIDVFNVWIMIFDYDANVIKLNVDQIINSVMKSYTIDLCDKWT